MTRDLQGLYQKGGFLNHLVRRKITTYYLLVGSPTHLKKICASQIGSWDPNFGSSCLRWGKFGKFGAFRPIFRGLSTVSFRETNQIDGTVPLLPPRHSVPGNSGNSTQGFAASFHDVPSFFPACRTPGRYEFNSFKQLWFWDQVPKLFIGGYLKQQHGIIPQIHNIEIIHQSWT